MPTSYSVNAVGPTMARPGSTEIRGVRSFAASRSRVTISVSALATVRAREMLRKPGPVTTTSWIPSVRRSRVRNSSATAGAGFPAGRASWRATLVA
ncbi:hypothetical protein SALBM217S_01423 [Streptomyces griseoloalbus]